MKILPVYFYTPLNKEGSEWSILRVEVLQEHLDDKLFFSQERESRAARIRFEVTGKVDKQKVPKEI